jgi:hypothetical protein
VLRRLLGRGVLQRLEGDAVDVDGFPHSARTRPDPS